MSRIEPEDIPDYPEDVELRDEPVECLHVFMDNCASQCKNRFVMACWQYATKRFHDIYLYYPIPGHSYMPIDRCFAKIEKMRKKKDNIQVPSQWVEMVKAAQKTTPFKVVYVHHPLTDNMEDDGTPIVKIRDFKKSLNQVIRPFQSISAARGVHFSRGKLPEVRDTMSTTLTRLCPILKKGIKHSGLKTMIENAPEVDQAFQPIKAEKLADVLLLLKYVALNEGITFYSNLTDATEETVQEADDLE